MAMAAESGARAGQLAEQVAQVTRTARPKPRPDEHALGFGLVFTDHMLRQAYRAEHGWGPARIEPYGPLALDPAAGALHYGQSVFDGLKAFRGADGGVRLFRPQAHFERLRRSAARLCMPAPDAEEALRSLRALVALDEAWVPRAPGTALYARPAIVATEGFLGVRPAREYLYFVILSPVGAYYPEGLAPVKILVEDAQVRAVPGGLGAAKTGANYAAGLEAGERARRAGFSQVLWLDGREHRYLEEVGAMNLMLRFGDEVVTPPLSGSILPGVTRDSVLTLLHAWGVPVAERPVAIDDVLDAARAGTLREVWGTGTAAVISPVGELAYREERVVVNGGHPGELTQRLYEGLTAIQYARVPDPYGWTVPV
jgi:branched-chain amino acid aminotransferase